MGELRPAPFYEATLLPVPPRKVDCVGEDCPVVGYNSRCFFSTHHLFFQHNVYLALEFPYNELVNDENAQVKLAHCRHNSTYPRAWHNLYDFTLLPDEEVAARYLEESRLLSLLDVKVKDMSADINGLFNDTPMSRYRLFAQGAYRRRMQQFEENMQAYNDSILKVGTIEVLPMSIVGRRITELGRQRNELSAKARQVPELAATGLARLKIAA